MQKTLSSEDEIEEFQTPRYLTRYLSLLKELRFSSMMLTQLLATSATDSHSEPYQSFLEQKKRTSTVTTQDTNEI